MWMWGSKMRMSASRRRGDRGEPRHVVAHRTAGCTPFLDEGGGHAGEFGVDAELEAGDDVERDAHEERLEHAVPPAVLVEVLRGERPEGGRDETGIVRAQRVGHEVDADRAHLGRN